jgi:4-amino-4-deoxy-L-arabinose transferase-like glycosyltransferase
VNQPSPAIVAQNAVRRLPRWALLLLCIAYIVPGFVGRDPWRGADMTAYGYMLELAQGNTPWLDPLLVGLAPETDGLLPYWLGAWSMQLAPSWLSPEFAVRLPFMLLMALTLLSTWYGIYALARSSGAQPVAFAFGGEAQPADYARAMADGGLLALLACLGLAQPSHETTSYLTQLCCTAWIFYGLAAAPLHRTLPLVSVLAGLAGMVLSGAPSLALLFALGGVVVCLCDPSTPKPDRARMRIFALGIAAMAAAAAVTAWGLDLWRWRLAWPQDNGKDWGSLARLLLWFTWPAWPLAFWTLWRWRKQILNRQLHRHLLLPLWFVLVSAVTALGTLPSDRALLLGLPALATLAAFALPTLRRSMSALIDWFTLLFFSVSAIAIWVIWISTQTGFPAKPAANVAKLARGFTPEFSALALAVALAASAAWCALVWWRTGRHRSAIWKSLVLPASGAALCWLLLTTLWMPMLDYARSDAPQMRKVAAAAGHPACMQMHGLERSQLAALQYHGKLRLVLLEGGNTACRWLVVAPQQPDKPVIAPPPDLTGWTLQHRIDRPTERGDILELYLPDAD